MVSTFISDPKQIMSMIDRCVKTYEYRGRPMSSVEKVSIEYNITHSGRQKVCFVGVKKTVESCAVWDKRLASGENPGIIGSTDAISDAEA